MLIAIYFLGPWIEVDGKYFLRFDLAGDTFWVFFNVWHQTDAFYFLTLPLLLLLALFFATSIKGRIWCGYACPQTVFLDWLIRPLEEFFEGNAHQRKKKSLRSLTSKERLQKIAKHLTFFGCGSLVGNTALMYFLGPQTVLSWVQSSPVHHPGPFAFVMAISALFYLDFAWFREQFCSFVCPYARFQAVLLDETSPVAHYHASRGEPRGKENREGDCIDCGLCVDVCPTGIDIRDGLQLECIQCLRCVDACNRIMLATKKPLHLIEFTTPQKPTALLNKRAVIYAFGFLLIGMVAAWGWWNRSNLEVTLIRQARSTTATYSDGKKANFFQLRITNTSSHAIGLKLSSLTPGVTFICGQCDKMLEPYESRRASLVVVLDKQTVVDQAMARVLFDGGEKDFEIPLFSTKSLVP